MVTCHISCGPNICGPEGFKVPGADYLLFRLYLVNLKSSSKFCLIFLEICEQLLLYPFYSSEELNLETVSNVLKEPQLINGTHLCG